MSESKETKMNISNLARTIGITVVGYSCTDPSADEIMRAVRICIFCKYKDMIVLYRSFRLSIRQPQQKS